MGLEQLVCRPWYHDLIPVNSGRNALLYLIRAKRIQKLYIPAFLCDSVSLLCDRYGFDYAFYSIHGDFTPDFDRELVEGEWLYVVNYYGQITPEKAKAYQNRFGNVILDNVQAFFQRPVPGMDTVYSCRKFFGVPDGGYVATDAVLEEPLEWDVSKDRMRHVLGRFEGCGSDYYSDFQANDEAFEEMPLRTMSRLTRNILGAVDYDGVRTRRNENYAVLEQALGASNKLKLTAPDGPYCYPYYHPNGMALKKWLASQKVYVATLWPNVLSLEGTLEKDYAENILPLPCDQRYDSADMDRICQLLARWEK